LTEGICVSPSFSFLFFSFLGKEKMHSQLGVSYAYTCIQPTDQLDLVRSYQQTTARKKKETVQILAVGRNKKRKARLSSTTRQTRKERKKKQVHKMREEPVLSQQRS
jgi:hypothetical protein